MCLKQCVVFGKMCEADTELVFVQILGSFVNLEKYTVVSRVLKTAMTVNGSDV